MDYSANSKCCVCEKRFADAHSLEAHIATVHAFYAPYECEICQNALFPTDHSLREHYLRIHNKRTFTIKYEVSPELDQRRELLRQLMVQSSNDLAEDVGLYNPYTSQLLQSCTAKMLQEQWAKSTELLAAKSNLEDGDETNNKTAESDLSEGNQSMAATTASGEGSSNTDGKLNFLDSKYPPPFGRFNFDEDQRTEEIGIDFQSGMRTSTPVKLVSKKRGRRQQSGDGNDRSRGEGAEEIECVDCKRKVGKYRNSTLIHTSTHHCDQPIFECLSEGCAKKWYSLSARTKEHIETKHGGDHALLKDNRAQLVPQLKAKAAKLFPALYSNYSTAMLE